MRGSGGSPAIGTTTFHPTSAAGTSTSVTTRRGSTGLHPGNRLSQRSTPTSAGTGSRTPRSPRRTRAFGPRCSSTCHWGRPSKSGVSVWPISARSPASCRSSRRPSSASGMRRMTRPTSSATSRPARSRSSTESSTTRPNTASVEPTSHTSHAPSQSRDSTPTGTRSWARIAAGSGRSPSNAAPPETPWRTAGRRTGRTTCG